MPSSYSPPKSREVMMVRRAGLMLVLVLFSGSAAGQEVESRLAIGPALLQSDEETSVGVRWTILQAVGGHFTQDAFPRRFQADFSSDGTLALDPDANLEAIDVSVQAGWFVALFRPPTDPDPTDPDAVPVGGFDYGSFKVGAAAALESDQRIQEVNGVIGGRLSYVNSRQDYPWPLVPALQVQFAAVLPVASELSGDVDVHARGDLNAAWHLPILSTPLTFHADLWYWNAFGADREVAVVRALEGLFGSLALGYEVGVPLGNLVVHEAFVRWSTGEVPVRSDERTAWMLGIVVGR